jgi:hypothetical protein
VANGDALLAIDRNGNGSIDDGRELFGSAFQLADGSRAEDGFAALASLDSNHDGQISAADCEFAALRAWLDGNSDGVSQEGELVDLASLGIVSIDLSVQAGTEMNNGNWLGLESNFTTQDGQTHDIADVWLRTDAGQDAPAAQDVPLLGIAAAVPDGLI